MNFFCTNSRYLTFSKHLVFMFFFLLYAPSFAYSQDYYDWNGFQTWEPTTLFQKDIIVNQKHPQASDDNPGTKELPLRTISHACSIVKPQERVLIYSGIYREMVVLKNSGLSKEKMISIEAAPGEKVVISGSEILQDIVWDRNLVVTDAPLDPDMVYTWNKKVWHTTVPQVFIQREFNPFLLRNIEEDDYPLMPWAHLTKNKAPFNLPRVLLFQDGKRMVQLASYDDLVRMPGSYYIGNNGKVIHMHPYGDINPNMALFEMATKSHLFKPDKVGYSYIQLSGITFQHCANSFLRTSTGAVTTLGGDHWIIENNTIREINSSGLEFGYYAFEFKDKNSLNIQPREGEEKGSVIVRNNTIYNCGTAGMRSYNVIDGLVENNLIYDCGWQNAENYWECGGIKLLRTRNTLVQNNHIHNIQGGNAIWLDWDNRYSRVTSNLIHDIQTIQGGVFIEASQYPNMVDNNFIWNVDGNGIYANDTDELIICHNLVANTTGSVVHAVVATQRKLNGRWLTANQNTVVNNLFIDGGHSITMDGENNQVNFNQYVSTAEPTQIDLKTIQANGAEMNSSFIRAFAKINDNTAFIWRSDQEVLRVSTLPYLNTSFFKAKRNDKQTYPGPFLKMDKEFRFLLNEIQAWKSSF